MIHYKVGLIFDWYWLLALRIVVDGDGIHSLVFLSSFSYFSDY
jgi:hypothetical protein